jgi:translation initiation factor IF-1
VKANTQRKDMFEVQGVVTESLPNTMFRIEIQQGPEQLLGKTVLCTVNGTMRRFNIRVLPGDNVLADMTVYDLNRARITRRLREADEMVQVAEVIPEREPETVVTPSENEEA